MKRLAQSPNYKNGKFENLTETPMLAPDASYWKIMKERLTSKAQTKPEKPLPVIKTDLKTAPESGKIQLTWLGHSTLYLQLKGKTILIDPVFSKRTSPFQFMGPKRFDGTEIYGPEDFPAIDFLLISHDHYDHLDKKTVQKMAEKVGKFYVPLGVGKHLQDWKIPAEKIQELDWWQEIQLTEELLLAATPARHFSGRGLGDRNETLWTSYVLKTETHAIYLGADSGYGPHFKQIGQKYGPFDLTTLECGQYNTAWPNIHMMPEETAQAHLDLKGKVLLPIHWSKFSLALHSWTEPIERLLNQTEKTNISATDWVEDVPESWTLENSIELAKILKTKGVDLVDCSSGGNVPVQKIKPGPGYQTPFAQEIKKQSGILTGAVGLITNAFQADHIIRTGQADMVIIAREFLRDPYFALTAATELKMEIAWPVQYERAKPRK